MKPVYIINGFLGSGKTEFINFTLDQPYFQSSGKTLLLLCEEGEEEYDPYVLKRSKTIVETIEEEADFTPEKMVELEKKYHPERIIIEYNGMWKFRDLRLPWHWEGGAADHNDRCIHLPYVFYEYEIYGFGHDPQIRNDHLQPLRWYRRPQYL